MSLQTVLNLALNANLVGSAAVGGGNPQFAMSFQPFAGGTLPTGTGSGKADQLWTKQVTLAAGANLDQDLTSLGNDNLGNALAPVTLKVLAILMRGNLACTYVASAAVHAGGGGSGFTNGDTLTAAGGTGTAAQFTATVSGGVVTAVTPKLANGFTGGSYTVNPSVTANAVTGGTGTGCTLDLTMATVVEGAQTYIETDYLSIGGDNTTNAWVSFFADKSDIIKLYSGNTTLPGFLITGNASNAGWAIGSTNKLLKFLNSGSNPITFNIIGIGASA